jgi:hypothetical protein
MMRRLMTRRFTALIVLCSALTALTALPAPRLANAQRSAANADSSLHHGLVERAESLYYAGARNRPRDPSARWSLGNFLIARGATRIGMTLVEEAMQFGFDKDRASRALAPVYLDLGEYRKVLSLPGATVSPGDRQRARFLNAHPARTIAPDSTISAAYTPATNASGFGALTIRINGRSVNAQIVDSGPGVALAEGSAAAKAAHRFVSETLRGTIETPAVVDSIGIARIVATNVLVTIAALPAGTDARVSLAFLARYAPTFDPRAKLITLRTSGNVPPATMTGSVLSTLRMGDRLSVLKAGGWVPLDDPSILRLITAGRWTLDAKHGAITIAAAQ